MEVIQQWQYNGAVHPDMLKDDAFQRARELGITALQSYVPWANVEPKRGSFEFSLYDPLVEKLKQHGMGWVPFLILGPYYSTPEWFMNSEESVFATCIEHGTPCRIQSIWNPHLGRYAESLIRAFHEHYGESDLIKSVLLGISGNWGESIFPVSGGFIEEKHMHPGWWCADEHALAHFRQALREKYGEITSLNSAWGSNCNGFEDVSFPELDAGFALGLRLHQAGYRLLGWLPRGVKSLLRAIAFRAPEEKEIKGESRRWVDFVQWYVSSMTGWAEFWLKTARDYFKDTPLYIVTGGDGNPMMGADFFAQAKVAAQYKAGIRVTSLTDSYTESFFLGRLAASPCRFYDAYFQTEEAVLNNPAGVPMRVFDALTSGARGIYIKNLLGHGRDLCTGRYFAPASVTPCTAAFEENRGWLSSGFAPDVDVAVLYPNTAIFLDYRRLVILRDFCTSLRERLDFDLLDEGMIADGALERYSIFITGNGYYIPPGTCSKISDWVEKGGLHISAEGIRDAVHNLRGRCKGRSLMDLPQGVFASSSDEETFFYNSGGRQAVAALNGTTIIIPRHSLLKVERKMET